MITVINNVLSEELFKEYQNTVLNLSWNISVTNNYDSRFNFEHKCNNECNHVTLFQKVLDTIINDVDIDFKNITRIRHAIMPHTTNNNINKPHVDQDDEHISVLIYLLDSDGDTIFYDTDWETEIYRVSPKANTAVIFSGDIPHSSSRPCENDLRIIGNFNLRK